MPIAPEFRHFYRTPQWREARKAVLGRSGGKCEFCGKPGNAWVCVNRDGTGRWNRALLDTLFKGPSATSYLASEVRSQVKRKYARSWDTGWWHPATESDDPATGPMPAAAPIVGRIHLIIPVLTIAHMNHTPGDDRLDNLRALCQWCHLRYDQEHHRIQRSIRKDRERPILVLIERLSRSAEALQGIA